MRIQIDRFHNQLFITPNIGFTYGRTKARCKYAICISWLCFGIAIGFCKQKGERREGE